MLPRYLSILQRTFLYDPKALLQEVLGRLRLLRIPRAGNVTMELHAVKFVCDLGQDRAFRRMYAGCYQSEILCTLERYLTAGDTFVDVGANVGFISAYAAGLVGRSGQVHSFEPVPKYFSQLKSVSRYNPQYQIFANPTACGDAEGSIQIAVDRNNIGGSSFIPNRVSDIEERVNGPSDNPGCLHRAAQHS